MNTLAAQVRHLEQRITVDETGKEKFVVIPMEAGLGKSRSADRIIGEHIANGGNRTFLIIKRFISEVEQTVSTINGYGRFAALGLTHENWQKYKNSLYDFDDIPVIVTTHTRYGQMCSDPSLAQQFENRHTMIVDEAIGVDVYSFSEHDVVYAESFLPLELHRDLLDVCKGLIMCINRLRPAKLGNKIVPCYPRTEQNQLHEFTASIEANMDQIKPEYKEKARHFVQSLGVLYNNPCLYSNGNVYGRDESLKRFTLQNNIILDANGAMDTTYTFDNAVTVDNMPHLTDHSRWTLTQVKFNSSASNIEQADNYWEKVCELIGHNQTDKSHTLVVCHNKHQDGLTKIVNDQGLNVAIEHFGNIVGKNDWRDFQQIWIVGTPNIPFPVYPLYYAAAKGKHEYASSVPKTTIQLATHNGKLRFCDSWIESIRHSRLLCDVYQAVKRINRDNKHDAQVFVVTNDDELLVGLANQMRGIRRTLPILLDGVTVQGKEKRVLKVDALVDWVMKAHKGKYPKRDVCEALEIDRSHLTRYLKHARIVQLRESGRITTKGQHIVVNH